MSTVFCGDDCVHTAVPRANAMALEGNDQWSIPKGSSKLVEKVIQPFDGSTVLGWPGIVDFQSPFTTRKHLRIGEKGKPIHGKWVFHAAFEGSGDGFKALVEKVVRVGGLFVSGSRRVGTRLGYPLYRLPSHTR